MKYLTCVLGSIVVTLLALMAGFFYAFSVSVMPGLDLTEPTVAIPAMQKINEAVRNPVFFGTFFLTPVIAILAALVAWFGGLRSASFWFAMAAVLYCLLGFLPTVVVNVPMNEALALVADPAPALWAAYSSEWTQWNTIRTVTTTVALLAALVGLQAIRWRKTGA
ncbi:MAG: DUF1772 domain-containing protein [Burkholderiaceae bacterium]